MNPHPMDFSDDNIAITESLRERGKMFWRCRGRNYVCYKSFVDDGIKTAVGSELDRSVTQVDEKHRRTRGL